MNPRLPSTARWILAGLSLALVLLLFPPFWYGTLYGVGARQWHFVLDSRLTTWDGGRAPRQGALDLPLLVLEFLGVGVGMGAAWYLTLPDREMHRGRTPVPNRAPLLSCLASTACLQEESPQLIQGDEENPM